MNALFLKLFVAFASTWSAVLFVYCLRMATKLLKLTAEDRHQVKEEGVHLRLASLASEEAMEDLHSHLRAVEKENARLKNKVQCGQGRGGAEQEECQDSSCNTLAIHTYIQCCCSRESDCARVTDCFSSTSYIGSVSI